MLDTVSAKVFMAHVHNPHFSDTLLLHAFNRPEVIENARLHADFLIALLCCCVYLVAKIIDWRGRRVCRGSSAAAPIPPNHDHIEAP